MDTGLVGHVAPPRRSRGSALLPPPPPAPHRPSPARLGRAHVTRRRHSAAGRERGAFRAPPARAPPFSGGQRPPRCCPLQQSPLRLTLCPLPASAAPEGSSGCFKTGPGCSAVRSCPVLSPPPPAASEPVVPPAAGQGLSPALRLPASSSSLADRQKCPTGAACWPK